jgi:UDPglucose--hexose-1-phosphate uridylyltransferase
MIDAPHRRRNLLTGDWVLVSPQRMGRPWQGETAPVAAETGPAYDPACYLCPGNARVGGASNPPYQGVFVFDNDFPALLPAASEAPHSDDLLIAEAERGICRVICYGPDHGRTLARMTAAEIAAIVAVWTAQWTELSARAEIAAVTIFENRGAMMGASNPHPHGQIWATSSIPNELARETATQAEYFARHGRSLLQDYAAREIAAAARVVLQTEHWLVVVPFWAAWPFETLILPLKTAAALDDLGAIERADLARVLGRLAAAYDRVFEAPFPYTMGLHQRPAKAPAPGFVMHLHFYPPLLRSATVRKHMVGFEMLAMPQRDITAEAAAARLRACVESA